MTSNAALFIKENIDLIQLGDWQSLLDKLVSKFGYGYDGDAIIADVLRTLRVADINIEDNYNFYSQYGLRNFTYKDDTELAQDLVNATYQTIDLEEIYKTNMWKLARCLNSGINKYSFYVQHTEDIVGYPERICYYILKGTGGRNCFACCVQIDDNFGGSIKLYKLVSKSCIHFFNNVGFVVDYSYYKREIDDILRGVLVCIQMGDMA